MTKDGKQADKLFNQSYEKYEKALKMKSDYVDVLSDWGSALSEQAKTKRGYEADKLFTESYDKHEKAVAIKPDMFQAWSNWGAGLLYQASQKRGNEQRRLLDEAKKKCLKAESLKAGSGAYNLACVSALLGDEKECQKWLEITEQAGTLPTRKHAMDDDDLKSMRDKAWFKKLRSKG